MSQNDEILLLLNKLEEKLEEKLYKTEDKRRRVKEGRSNQKERLFIRGKAISATPNIRGINQLPNPPIETGITIKKIIIKA